jgi:hypothetical protein
MQDRRLIAVDFDGVLSRNLSPWIDHSTISDEPNTGAISWLTGLLLDTRFDVCVHSCRGSKPEGVAAIMAWLVRFGLDRQLLDRITFSQKKPNARVFIDDRAIQFRGVWPTYDELANFTPWHPKTAHERRAVLTDVNYCEAASEGEIAEIWEREHRCLSCLHGAVCAVAQAIKQIEMAPAVTRCLGYTESFMPDLE